MVLRDIFLASVNIKGVGGPVDHRTVNQLMMGGAVVHLPVNLDSEEGELPTLINAAVYLKFVGICRAEFFQDLLLFLRSSFPKIIDLLGIVRLLFHCQYAEFAVLADKVRNCVHFSIFFQLLGRFGDTGQSPCRIAHRRVKGKLIQVVRHLCGKVLGLPGFRPRAQRECCKYHQYKK